MKSVLSHFSTPLITARFFPSCLIHPQSISTVRRRNFSSLTTMVSAAQSSSSSSQPSRESFNQAMATRALLAFISASPPRMIKLKVSTFCSSLNFQRRYSTISRYFSSDTNPSVFPPPDVSRLAEKARISLTPSEIEECGHKIRQVIDWFGQLQQVDVSSVEPAIRAEMEGGNLREDAPETFENSDSIRASIPSFDEVYLKVPKVLNKE